MCVREREIGIIGCLLSLSHFLCKERFPPPSSLKVMEAVNLFHILLSTSKTQRGTERATEAENERVPFHPFFLPSSDASRIDLTPLTHWIIKMYIH